MKTAYIGDGSLRSTSEATGKTMNTELRVENDDLAYPDTVADLGLYGFKSGNLLRTVHLSREHATELRDALNVALEEGSGA